MKKVEKRPELSSPSDLRYIASHDGYGTICRVSGGLDETGTKEVMRVTPVSSTQDIGQGKGKSIEFHDWSIIKEDWRPIIIAEWPTPKKPTFLQRLFTFKR